MSALAVTSSLLGFNVTVNSVPLIRPLCNGNHCRHANNVVSVKRHVKRTRAVFVTLLGRAQFDKIRWHSDMGFYKPCVIIPGDTGPTSMRTRHWTSRKMFGPPSWNIPGDTGSTHIQPGIEHGTDTLSLSLIIHRADQSTPAKVLGMRGVHIWAKVKFPKNITECFSRVQNNSCTLCFR